MVKLNAPVKFPWLWSLKESQPGPIEAYLDKPETFPRVLGFKDYDWLEWTSNTNTVMERNITETLGAGATVVLDPKSPSLFESSIPVRNMHALEWLAYYIDPPKWPAEIFGPVNSDLAAQGRQVFEKHCAGCHEYGDKDRTEAGLIHLRGKSPEFTGTDPTVARTIACPVPDVGPLEVTPTSYSIEDFGPAQGLRGRDGGEGVHRQFLRHDGSGRGRRHQEEGLPRGGSQRGRAAGDGGLRPARPRQVARHAPRHQAAGRPLCAKALARDLGRRALPAQWIGPDLARPPASSRSAAEDIRARRPRLRSGEARLRREPGLQPQDCLVDTTLTDYGNSNGGHVFGTDMSEADRTALLEYLKTY